MKLFRSIKARLALAAATGVALCLALTANSILSMTRLQDAMLVMDQSAQAASAFQTADMMHDALRGDVLLALGARDAGEVSQAVTDVTEHAAKFREAVRTTRSLISAPEAITTIEAVSPAVETYIASAEAIVATAATSRSKAYTDFPAFMTAFGELEERAEAASTVLVGAVEASRVSANAQVAQTRKLLLGVSLLAIVVLVAGARYLSLGITEPLSAMVDAANRAAQGHVGTRVTKIGHGEFEELALAFNALLAKLRETAAGIGGTAVEVTRAARELASVADDISAAAQSQASNLEETAASMEQLTATVKQNAANAGQANQLAGAARSVAEQGGSVVGAAVSAMSEINRSSRRIGDIITTIDEIAFQTNLLALNAAVEAARAGAHGRGFAVVAAEVRSLAGRSAAAAKEIKGLIGESSEKVEQGSAHVNRSGATLDEIVIGVKRVTDIVAEIAAASREQSVGIEEVNRAVSQMDQLTQSNAAQTEELSATAGTLASQAGELESLLAWFKLDGGDTASGAGHAAARDSSSLAREAPRTSAKSSGRALGSGRSQRSSSATRGREGVHHQTAVSSSSGGGAGDSDGFVDF